MSNQEIELLLNESGVPCVTIILPMHRLSPDRIKDSEAVTSAVNQVEMYLLTHFQKTDKEVASLIKSIDGIVETIDYTHSKDGIGIFVSPHISTFMKFPFPVEEKINVAETFDIRDILYYMNTIIDYHVLSISKKHIRLLKGKGEELQEIKDSNFPVTYVEMYEYDKPSLGTSFGSSTLKEYEKDKSVMEEIRLIDFLRKTDHVLEKYISSNSPLIISGGAKEINDYLTATKHKKRIIGKVMGSYNFNGGVQLAWHTWNQIIAYQTKKNETMLLKLRELVGKKLLAVGLEEVWKVSHQAKGLRLIVEKDYECHAFITSDNQELKFQKPFGRKKYIYIRDAVERILKTVRAKGGEIVFVENGLMKDFIKIALQLRY